MKYEEILLEEYYKLDNKKKVLLKKVEFAAWTLFKLKAIDKSIKEINWIIIKWIFLTKKIKQLMRLEYRAKRKFRELSKEYWPIEERLSSIKNTLTEYYDKQIEECILDLGIKDVENLNDLLIINNDKYREQLDEEASGDTH